MSEKPQAVREDGQEDLLEQIISQGLEKVNAPPQGTATQEAPPTAPRQEETGATASPASKKNRRSSVYLYLLVLFGAAFLMLLLAYFVQQRSSEDAISDLRDSMNLSRQELLDELRELEEENDELRELIDLWQNNSHRWQTQYEEKDGEATDLWNQNYDKQEQLSSWQSFWALELCYQAGDYERCAVILLTQKQGQYTYRTPGSAQERYEEIVQAVIDAGILDEDYERHPDDYKDLLHDYLSNGTFYYEVAGPIEPFRSYTAVRPGETAAGAANVSRETER